MRKQILSLCLSAVILTGSGAMCGMAAQATETAGVGATNTETAQVEEETSGEPEEVSDKEQETADQQQETVKEQQESSEEKQETNEGQQLTTDAAGNVITPETAKAIDNADLGTEEIAAAADTEQEAAETESKAQEAMQTPDTDGTQMNKSTIGAAFDSRYQFEKEDTTVYTTGLAVIKEEPDDNAQNMANLEKYAAINLTGTNDLKYWEVSIGGRIGYIDSSVITRDPAQVQDLKEDDARKEETEAQSKLEQEESIAEKTSEAKEEWAQAVKDERRSELANQTRNPDWSGSVLSRSKGAVYGPSGKETYYNLNMSGCVRNMNRRGYYYEVWVRNDGCKMFGDYIMCAANLGVHPFGSLVESSLGTCIVVDTGGFASGNPYQLDIAVTW